MKTPLFILLAAATPLAVLALPAPAAAFPVFDVTNYEQNLLQAARALEQINHQIQSLQNEATMIRQQARNLQKLDYSAVVALDGNFRKVERLIGQARGIGFEAGTLEQRFDAMFPGKVAVPGSRAARVAVARARLAGAFAALRGAIQMQTQVVTNIQSDRKLLGELVARSQDATGSLQAQQATNQLLALAAQQQLQLQAMLAVTQRAEAIEGARRTQAEAEGQAATQRFLGTGHAYTPQ